MEQSFWQSNEKGEKARFLRRREIFSRSKTSASAGRRIELPCGSDKILLGSQFSRPRFLAKISNASQKWSLFLGVSEGFLDARTLEFSRKGGMVFDLVFARTPVQSLRFAATRRDTDTNKI